MILTAQPPTRATLARLIASGYTRHGIDCPPHFAAGIKTADYDKLIDLAFYALTDTGDEMEHKGKFLQQCKEAGLHEKG